MFTNKLFEKRGFTLIELLVVIAIIGILSSVVLASLNTARDRARDAAVQSSMQTIRVQAEIVYDDQSNSYPAATDCSTGLFAAATSQTIADAIEQINDNATVAAACDATGGQDWAMTAGLSNGTFWCVDESGVAEAKTAGLGLNDECSDLTDA